MIENKKDQLRHIVIKGYKSIKDCKLNLKKINVFIGSNGAGKSNFLSAFTLLNHVIDNSLTYYGEKKGGNSFFYNGTKTTDSIWMQFWFNDDDFSFGLEMSEHNRLILSSKSGESTLNIDSVYDTVQNTPAELKDENHRPSITNQQWCVYHFHDTSSTSKIKQEGNLCNSKNLLQDASNLAAFLYRLQEHYPFEFKNILEAVRLVAPYFKGFELAPREANRELIELLWQQKDWTDILYASQLSDGTLRFICLATLLLQPTKLQPATIIIDEPELGLHPFAIAIFAEMVKKAAVNKQIILATQSVELLNQFNAEDVVVVDRSEDGSKFKRLDPPALADWLEDGYSLGELWNKNILGGRLSRC